MLWQFVNVAEKLVRSEVLMVDLNSEKRYLDIAK